MKRQGFMLRKGLFSGLTILLIAVFVYLAVQGNRLEKERQKRGSTVVETFKPTPVRALEPGDLEITAAAFEKQGAAGAKHRMEVRNSGEATYSGIRLKLDYLDAGGRKLEPVFRDLAAEISPGVTELAVEIPLEEIPAGAVDFHPFIVYADIEPESP